MVIVCNTGRLPEEVGIITPEGETRVHLMPGSRVALPQKSKVHPNELVRKPHIIVEEKKHGVSV